MSEVSERDFAIVVIKLNSMVDAINALGTHFGLEWDEYLKKWKKSEEK